MTIRDSQLREVLQRHGLTLAPNKREIIDSEGKRADLRDLRKALKAAVPKEAPALDRADRMRAKNREYRKALRKKQWSADAPLSEYSELK